MNPTDLVERIDLALLTANAPQARDALYFARTHARLRNWSTAKAGLLEALRFLPHDRDGTKTAASIDRTLKLFP